MEQMKIIGWVRTDFPEKFGAPRQSGLVRELTGRIEFAPEYRNKEGWMNIPISGFCGSFQKTSERTAGALALRSSHPDLAATGAWVCLQHARRFAQTPSDFPVSGWSRSVWMEKMHRT